MRAYKEWRLESVCLTGDALIAFRTNSRKAKTYCSDCPVKRDCLNYALLYDEAGIWGGTTETDRNLILLRAPQVRDLLELEALRAGILEHRYSVEEYVKSVREAQKAVRKARKERVPAPGPSLLVLQELLGEWSTQWVF